MSSLTLENMETILKNRKLYKRIVKYYLLEDGKKNNDLGVQNNFNGNASEISFINKIEDDRYARAKTYLEALNKLYESLSERRKLVHDLRYMDKSSVERIAFDINYSQDTVWKDLNYIKKKLLSILVTESNSK